MIKRMPKATPIVKLIAMIIKAVKRIIVPLTILIIQCLSFSKHVLV